ncbi:MAG: hypothetical protein JNK53_04980, partial [Phycisphaerae bacterium]|nr:hypothetical protein [Phycisphaerae bacterium]
MASTPHSTAELLSDSNIVGKRLPVREHVALAVAAVMLSISFWLGWKSQDMTMFAKVYLQNFLFVLAISLGGLFFVFVQHVTRASWSVAVRRPAEALMQNLRWIWVLFLPIAYLAYTHQLDALYPWANLDHLRQVAPAEADLVANKSSFLNQPFFFARAAFYFLVWGGLAWYFWRSSVRQDVTGDPKISARCGALAAPAALLFGVTTTLASVDWIMSLTPAWFSTMFGVYFFTVCCTGGLSAITLVCLSLQRAGYLRGIITPEHYQDLGKMIFAFGVVFWAYIAFSQYMLIWYGNIPEETTWFLVRQVGDWGWISVALLVGHFAIPFVFLISRWTKRWPATLAVACAWMLAFCWIDLYYLVMPTVPHDLGTFTTYTEFASKYAGESTNLGNPINWTMLVGMLALLAAGTAAAARRHALVPK